MEYLEDIPLKKTFFMIFMYLLSNAAKKFT